MNDNLVVKDETSVYVYLPDGLVVFKNCTNITIYEGSLRDKNSISFIGEYDGSSLRMFHTFFTDNICGFSFSDGATVAYQGAS